MFEVAEMAEFLMEMHDLREYFAKGLMDAAEIAQKDDKASIGEYQAAVGPYQAWDPLAPSTQATREQEGFDPDKPLERTGQLRDSIEIERAGDHVHYGSTDEKAHFAEDGTVNEPPRPFVGPAFYRKQKEIEEAMGQAAYKRIARVK